MWENLCSEKIEVTSSFRDESLLPSAMPVTTRSQRRALLAERKTTSDEFMASVMASVSATHMVVKDDMVYMYAVAPTPYAIYKENVLKLFEIAVKEKGGLHTHLYKNVIEYLLQDDMLNMSSTQWLVTWTASIRCHMNIHKTSPHVPFLENAIVTLQKHLEDDGHYVVPAAKFIEVYDWIVDFMGKQGESHVAVYVSALVPYMIRAGEGVWKSIELEKKSRILAKMMLWKELTAPVEYGLVAKCEEFLAKYKITA